MLLQAGLLAAALLQPAAGHFQLLFPPARGFDEDQLAKFPCGGQDRVAAAGSRTPFPLAGGPVQLDMGHTAARVQVLLAAGASPGANFSIELVPTLQEQGPRRFCLRGVSVPAGAGLKAGDVGTIQVVTNGDPDGGLYNVGHPAYTH